MSPYRWYTFFKLKEGDIIVDLGAHHGETTNFYSNEVGKRGSVIALEPDNDNYNQLEQRIKKNKLTNVRSLLMAIGKKTGETYLNLGKGDNAHSTTFTGRRFKYGRKLVPVITWDDLMDKFSLVKVDLAKVNVEGAEIEFLEGMSRVFPKKIVLEEHSRLGINREYLMKLLEERRYVLRKKKGSCLYLVRREGDE